MTKKDAAKLLELIQLSYPASYRDKDDGFKMATINMWHSSFEDVPYPIVEQAFNHYRMTNKFPPTVAEMVEELKNIHFQATECALIQKGLGNEEGVRQYRAIMGYTARYKDDTHLGGLNLDSLPPMLINGGGEYDRIGTPGDRMDRADRLPFLDAGEG